MAFCPMRLYEKSGVQHLSLNPFGSYYGKPLDYTHLGGNGLGAELAAQVSGALRPNAPSFNGQRVRFSLLLAPYAGDEPPVELQRVAAAFFYPYGVIYLRTPPGVDALLSDDVRALIAARQRQARLLSTSPLPPPTAFLASPSDGVVHLVWDPPRDERITSYEVRWRPHHRQDIPWQTQTIPSGHRAHITGLSNGVRYRFQVCALAAGRPSAWTPEAECCPGPVPTVPLFSAASGISLRTLLKIVYYGLVHGLTTRFAGVRWGRG